MVTLKKTTIESTSAVFEEDEERVSYPRTTYVSSKTGKRLSPVLRVLS